MVKLDYYCKGCGQLFDRIFAHQVTCLDCEAMKT